MDSFLKALLKAAMVKDKITELFDVLDTLLSENSDRHAMLEAAYYITEELVADMDQLKPHLINIARDVKQIMAKKDKAY